MCLSCSLESPTQIEKPHLAAVKTACGVFCGLSDDVALQTEIAASSAWAYLSTQLCSLHSGTSKKVHVEGRADSDRICMKDISSTKTKELLLLQLTAVLGENPVTGGLLKLPKL